jgi:CheY-like chemotaxis protein
MLLQGGDLVEESDHEVIKNKTMEQDFPFKRILVADDSDIDIFIVHTILKRYKPSLLLYYALDIESALSMLKSFKSTDLPCLVLLDLNFGKQKKQGLDFMMEFATLYPGGPNNPKVLGLSAYTAFRDVTRIKKNFPDLSIIEKPFSIGKMMNCLSFSLSGDKVVAETAFWE